MKDMSRYIRTTGMLSAKATVYLPDNSRIRFLKKDEALSLADLVRKRNVFARHSWENNFYLQRITELADHTVVEVFMQGDPKQISEKAEETAEIIEKLFVLSSTLVVPKDELLRKLGISTKTTNDVNVTIGSECRYLKSKTIKIPKSEGVIVDDRFRKRFEKCGFHNLYHYCLNQNSLSEKLIKSVDWLFESRREPNLHASIVKTAIAMESLLIFSESESLARSLSERAAFILSSSSEERAAISNIIKKFYNARSGVVHGSKRKLKSLTPYLLESVDRLTVLLYLVIAANFNIWATTEDLSKWCETERWGNPSMHTIPFPALYLRNAIALSEKEIK